MRVLPTLVLVSASPRRLQILQQAGFTPEVAPLDVEELSGGLEAEALVLQNSQRKLAASPLLGKPNRVLIAADTVVVLGGEILGKPRDAVAAKKMLGDLSGVEHRVITGLVLRYGEKSCGFAVSTRVVFRSISPQEIEAYIATKEPYDKAGGYGIQGVSSLFVEKVEGCFLNVMGFPLKEFLVNLGKLTDTFPFDWVRPHE